MNKNEQENVTYSNTTKGKTKLCKQNVKTRLSLFYLYVIIILLRVYFLTTTTQY